MITLFSGGISQFTDCLFHDNEGGTVGVISVRSSSAAVFTNCTFSENRAIDTTAPLSGAVYATGSHVDFQNCIIWNNEIGGVTTGAEAALRLANGATASFSNSLLHHSDLTFFGMGNPDGSSAANDPLFLDPAANDFRLSVGSAAINAGNNTYNTADTDLGGSLRLQGGVIDLGAYEFNALDPAILWLTDTDEDGSPYGIEQALGTDPNVADPSHQKNVSFAAVDPGGDTTLTFGRNPAAVAGTIWVLSRSTTLMQGSFVEVYRFDGTTSTEAAGLSSTVTPTSFSIVDASSPTPRAFYRFEAVYTP